MANLKYFYGSIGLTLAFLAIALFAFGPAAAVIVAVLGILETSLSFDNAVVNSTVLKDFDATWRSRFLTWGMVIAVFGMRLIFPLGIVSVVGHLNPVEALMLAVKDPATYATTLASAHTQIMGFGGAFLSLIALKYFMDIDKETHWVPFLEGALAKFGKIDSIEIAVTLLLLVLVPMGLPTEVKLPFQLAGIAGVLAYVIVESLDVLLGDDAAKGVKAGLAGFLYLEVLDASFSFDGVIGSLALSNNLFVIALGLGIGAMFVRSMTIMLVEKGTLEEYEYLENGAFWAIATLAGFMFAETRVEIPDVVTGLTGAGLIIAAFVTSVLKKAATVHIDIESTPPMMTTANGNVIPLVPRMSTANS